MNVFIKKSRGVRIGSGFAPIIIVIVIAALVLIGGGGWYVYEKGMIVEGITAPKACTQEAKLCPDGKTSVSRTGPKCEFAACGSQKFDMGDEIDTSNWKTYRNEKYGFEFQYPNNWNIEIRSENKDSLISITDGGLNYFDVENPKTCMATSDFDGNGARHYLHQEKIICIGLSKGYFLLRLSAEIRNIKMDESEQVLNQIAQTFKTSGASTWKTYRNEKYGFEVKYPTFGNDPLSNEKSYPDFNSVDIGHKSSTVGNRTNFSRTFSIAITINDDKSDLSEWFQHKFDQDQSYNNNRQIKLEKLMNGWSHIALLPPYDKPICPDFLMPPSRDFAVIFCGGVNETSELYKYGYSDRSERDTLFSEIMNTFNKVN